LPGSGDQRPAAQQTAPTRLAIWPPAARPRPAPPPPQL